MSDGYHSLYEHYIYNIINPTNVVNAQKGGVEIPQGFNQIIGYDPRAECVEIAKNKRYSAGGLNAGILIGEVHAGEIVNVKGFYQYLIEVETIPPLNENSFGNHKQRIFNIKNISINEYEFPNNNNVNTSATCNFSASNDSYVLPINK